MDSSLNKIVKFITENITPPVVFPPLNFNECVFFRQLGSTSSRLQSVQTNQRQFQQQLQVQQQA